MKLHHGGRLRTAAAHYGIAPDAWLDFSTAVNPQPWPVPTLPAEVWHRLPEEEDGLLAVAARYYGHATLLPVSGTQAVIESLPGLLSARRVWVPAIGYQEHAHCWKKQGHSLHYYTSLPTALTLQDRDVVVVINPNNPTGERYSPAVLRALGNALAAHQGLLVVDEAFMDSTPQFSLLGTTEPEPLPLADNMLILRSFGKFFGLAGVRLGFCFANPRWLERLDEALGPWAVNHPARWIARQALADTDWQDQTRIKLRHAQNTLQRQLHAILGDQCEYAATDLFVTLKFVTLKPVTLKFGGTPAKSLHHHLARNGIFTRLFAEDGLLRLGVDPDEQRTARLLAGIESWPQA